MTETDQISDRDLRRLTDLIGSQCGMMMAPAKRIMLETRLRKRVRTLGLKSFAAYCDYIHTAEGRSQEWPNLIDAVTTHKTDFFREPAHFDFLMEQALPELSRSRGIGTRRPLLVWSAACSTGEEPYTLAMVVSKYAESRGPDRYHFRIEATDISGAVIETAQTAVYPAAAVEPVPRELCRKHVLQSRDRSRGMVRMSPEIRSRVRFRQLNLMDSDYGFGELFDVVFCRNVMIYFEREAQQKVLNRISLNLQQGGYLLMGHSESLNGLNLPLVQVAPTVYRRLNG